MLKHRIDFFAFTIIEKLFDYYFTFVLNATLLIIISHRNFTKEIVNYINIDVECK